MTDKNLESLADQLCIALENYALDCIKNKNKREYKKAMYELELMRDSVGHSDKFIIIGAEMILNKFYPKQVYDIANEIIRLKNI